MADFATEIIDLAVGTLSTGEHDVVDDAVGAAIESLHGAVEMNAHVLSGLVRATSVAACINSVETGAPHASFVDDLAEVKHELAGSKSADELREFFKPTV